MRKSICIYSKNSDFTQLCNRYAGNDCKVWIVDDKNKAENYLKNEQNCLILTDQNIEKADEKLTSLIESNNHQLFSFSRQVVNLQDKSSLSFPFDLELFFNERQTIIAENNEGIMPLEDSVTLNSLIGSSPVMVKLRKQLKEAAEDDCCILLTGESGTGKSLAAMIIHQLSKRAKKGRKIIVENAAAIAPGLIESELFGVEKGAYTDSGNGRKGLIRNADKSTFFLDEIGEIDCMLQAKLLLVVQDGIIRSVGSDETDKVDVRFIFATNANLTDKIARGEFRQDLYFRISEIQIELPPLRSHPEDIKEIAEDYLARNKKYKALSSGALEKLMDYSWPGNVRQLEHVLNRVSKHCEKNVIYPEQIDFSQKDRLLL